VDGRQSVIIVTLAGFMSVVLEEMALASRVACAHSHSTVFSPHDSLSAGLRHGTDGGSRTRDPPNVGARRRECQSVDIHGLAPSPWFLLLRRPKRRFQPPRGSQAHDAKASASWVYPWGRLWRVRSDAMCSISPGSNPLCTSIPGLTSSETTCFQ
jgi:hypothetical protein